MRAEPGVRRTIIREWMALPPEKRRTVEQAAAFAAKAAETHRFGAGGDPQARVVVWLAPRTGRA
ncbi:hypothetical protein GCM10011611_46730 [Aliidongia dinghuensis]|uniref:Uncharacterized protein n=1 Tax=Aliidongia dinghuensis TaxID=1867774 RepID=A0A8J2YX57_9PROT|nr:hypothetical protein [Aliidongia dinghuensis]GGF35129.1 hypothetical protein GCM10011611_46730 [Aliidongia dinghuensis]